MSAELDYTAEYQSWLLRADAATRAELAAIAGDARQIEERFSLPLSFGTAGMRGIMRAGINGMNVYTVAQTTQGLCALMLKESPADACAVAIAYDSRHNSLEFSRRAARVLAASGIAAYLFDDIRPTAELSFAIRRLQAEQPGLRTVAGINITASHNPKEYNGYKVYWSDGAQLPPEHADAVSAAVAGIDIFTGVRLADWDDACAGGLIKPLGEEMDARYLKAVHATAIRADLLRSAADKFSIVYTPLHGAGYKLVPRVLREAGLEKLICVPSQMLIDGSFPTVKAPNPEFKEVFTDAIALAREHGCDLIIGTDPDSDRTGTVVRCGEDYITLTGNQIGVLLCDYIIASRRELGQLPANACVIKSIVSTTLADKICRANGVALVEVLTGFKFIGEKIKDYETTREHEFILGFEESYGYLTGTYARDKDAVNASLIIAEMAAWHMTQGRTLHDALTELYAKYGFTSESVETKKFPGLEGMDRMNAIMRNLRAARISSFGGVAVSIQTDYIDGIDGLPPSDVLQWKLADGSTLLVRPSGTEPLIKIYFLLEAADEAAAATKRAAMLADVERVVR